MQCYMQSIHDTQFKLVLYILCTIVHYEEMQCMICMEPGADSFPPCGFASEAPLFHAHCLEQAQRHCSQRCPHCNCSPPRCTPMFLPIKRHAFLSKEELEHALEVVKDHLGCSLQVSRRGHYQLVPLSGGKRLSLRRMACLGPRGAVLRDGFALRLQC